MSMDEIPTVVERPDGKLSIPIQLPSPHFDPESYRIYVEDFGISDEQADELLATVWSIMKMFVEMGFDLNGVKLFEGGNVASALDSAGVKSSLATTRGGRGK